MNAATLAEPEVVVVPADALTEVIGGEVVEKPGNAASSWVGSRLALRLGTFAEDNGIGTALSEMMFVLDAESRQKRRPDVALVLADRWPVGQRPPRPGDWQIVPDLAVEVISPGDTFSGVLAKVGENFDFGVRQVWVIDPVVQRVIVYDSLDNSHSFAPPAELTSALVPGWTLPLAKLFGHPPPP